MGLIGENNPAGCIKGVSGGAEASDSSDKQGGVSTLHLASALLFGVSVLSAHRALSCCWMRRVVKVRDEFSVAAVVLPVCPQ